MTLRTVGRRSWIRFFSGAALAASALCNTGCLDPKATMDAVSGPAASKPAENAPGAPSPAPNAAPNTTAGNEPKAGVPNVANAAGLSGLGGDPFSAPPANAGGGAPPPQPAVPGVPGSQGAPGVVPGGVPGVPPQAGQTEQVKAGVGVGIKGRSLDSHEGIIVTPAKALFAAKERIAFDIAVPQALALYKAVNGDGPKTHDEFMQKVIGENQIQLPQLPTGHRYVYDPTTEQLMVERPKKN